MSNVLAAKKATEETYQIMYTVAWAFGWDIIVIQTLYACFQAILISSLKGNGRRDGEVNGLCGIFVNQDIYRIA